MNYKSVFLNFLKKILKNIFSDFLVNLIIIFYNYYIKSIFNFDLIIMGTGKKAPKISIYNLHTRQSPIHKNHTKPNLIQLPQP